MVLEGNSVSRELVIATITMILVVASPGSKQKFLSGLFIDLKVMPFDSWTVRPFPFLALPSESLVPKLTDLTTPVSHCLMICAMDHGLCNSISTLRQQAIAQHLIRRLPYNLTHLIQSCMRNWISHTCPDKNMS